MWSLKDRKVRLEPRTAGKEKIDDVVGMPDGQGVCQEKTIRCEYGRTIVTGLKKRCKLVAEVCG